MEPHISAGDVVHRGRVRRRSEDPGGRRRASSPVRPSAEPGGVAKTRLHRIVAENPDGTFVTAGDANAEPDSTPLERGQITGQARLLVPGVGLPGLWLATGNLPAVSLWSLLTLLAVAAAVFARSEDEEEDTDKDRDDGGGSPPPAPVPPGARPPSARPGSFRPHPALPGSPRQGRAGSRRWKAAAAVGIVAALCALVIATSTAFASAAFTDTTVNSANTFGTAVDWMPPSVSLASPGSTVRASVTVTADASDAESGIRSVAVQYLPPGGAWTTLCTSVAAPYSCTWNTQTVPDGAYSLRAVATDNAGFTGASTTVQTTVANSFSVVLADPGEIQRGNVILSTTLTSPGNTLYTVRVEYSAAGANKWNTLCLNLLAPYNCTWLTGTFTSGEFYDLRAVAVAGLTSTYSETITDVLVDNAAPTVTMSDPGTPLRGVSTFTASPADPHSGVAQAQIQYARTGTGTWTTLCAVTVPPYSCRFDTTTLPNASYSFRAIATDEAGNSTTSAAVTNRIVDNTVSSVSVEDPGAYLTGEATLTAAANSSAGVGSVRIQTAPAGTGMWTTRCMLAAAPFSCTWDTRTVIDGQYDFRAVLTDGTGKDTISATVAGRRVDNSPLRGADVQAVNGTGIQGRFDAGDALSFTYSQQVNLASVTPGWNGTALPVTVRLRDGNVPGVGTGNSGDTVDIQRPGSTVNVGTLNTKGNFAKSRKTVTFNATMTSTTVTTDGIPRTVVTLTLGGTASGAGSIRASSNAAAMVWSPTSSVTSAAGVASSLAPATETGTLDRDF